MYMNNFRRFIVLMGLALTLLVGSFTAPALAQGTPAQQDAPTAAVVVKMPSKFVLSADNGTTITYSKSSQDSPAELDYKTQNGEQKFTDREIETIDIGIGTLVTVIVKRPINPDIGGIEVKLTVLLPEVNLPISGGEDPVKSSAILTTQLISGNIIRRPQLGQLQTYEILSLQGTASA